MPEKSRGHLDGKVAIVTGGGRGIGREEALYLASCGAAVVVNDFVGPEEEGSKSRVAPADEVVELIRGRGGRAIADYADVSDAAGAEGMVEAALNEWGTLDIVVNNAGILRDRMIFNMTSAEWVDVIRVHLMGHFYPTQVAARYWRERAKQTSEAYPARIINTSSTSGLVGSVGQSNYGAAKAGIAALTQIVSLEMAPYGVTANAIAPAARTRLTSLTESLDQDFDKANPANIAPLVGFLAGDSSQQVTGQVFFVYGGLIQLYQGWRSVSEISRLTRWTQGDLESHFQELFADHASAFATPALPI